MSLFLVPVQLTLPGMDTPGPPLRPSQAEEDLLRDRRSARIWIQRAIEYCDWRADLFKADRWHPERWYYLNGRRLLADVLYPSKARIEPALPSIDPIPEVSPEQREFVMHPRAWLVDRLMAIDRHYTDRQLLLHLSKAKLAAMLSRAIDVQLRKERAA